MADGKLMKAKATESSPTSPARPGRRGHRELDLQRNGNPRIRKDRLPRDGDSGCNRPGRYRPPYQELTNQYLIRYFASATQSPAVVIQPGFVLIISSPWSHLTNRWGRGSPAHRKRGITFFANSSIEQRALCSWHARATASTSPDASRGRFAVLFQILTTSSGFLPPAEPEKTKTGRSRFRLEAERPIARKPPRSRADR